MMFSTILILVALVVAAPIAWRRGRRPLGFLLGALAVLPEETVIAVEGTVNRAGAATRRRGADEPAGAGVERARGHPARAAVANGPLGEHDQARTLTEYILSRRRRILGDDHPDTLRTAAALTENPPAFGETP